MLCAVIVAVIGHAWVVNAQALRASALARPDVRISLPYQLVRPEFTVDGHMWIRYAVRLLEGEGPQMRRSEIDNAPHGREIHWNSGYAWWIALWGAAWQKATGLPLTQATERAAMWVNAPLLIGFSLLFAVWVTRRAGWRSGVMVGLLVVIQPNLYEGFWPGYADHHGIVLAALLGLALGAFWMRGGWVPRDQADEEMRAVSAARWSGFWGGVALWISAASSVPMIALVALSALAATIFTGDRLTMRAKFFPSVWRAWGVTGAATSLAFYLLEYFPHHLGWRLEVNHPLYALAWLAGAELTARVMAVLAVEGDPRAAMRRFAWTALWALPAALAPGVAVAVWKARVFLPADPFMASLHRTIVEFQPELLRLEQDGLLPHFNTVLVMPLIYVFALALLGVRGSDRWGTMFALGLTLPLHALCFYQSRWSLSTAPGQILIALCLLRAIPRIPWISARPWRITTATTLLLALYFAPTVVLRTRESFQMATGNGITAGDARQLIYREVAQVIRESQPEGEVVLFGSPNTSVNVGYFGDFKTLGTLYWENLEGLKAAAAISAARTEEEAAQLIKARGITHLAFFRDGNYIFEYAKLLRPNCTLPEAQQTFGFRLLGARQVPVWLEALPYAAPQGLPATVDREVLVFKVNFDLKPAQAAYNLAVLQARRQETDDALKTFEQALQFDPTHYPSALRRGEIFVQRRQWDAAQECFDLAVRIAPASERYRLLTQVGIGFAGVGEFARAVENYERALREAVSNTVAPNNLAWILATAPDEQLRNPARALELAQRCAVLLPDNPAMLGTLAAAQAAQGNFDAAAETLTRAMKLAQEQNKPGLLPQMEERLASYRAKKLWLAPR